MALRTGLVGPWNEVGSARAWLGAASVEFGLALVLTRGLSQLRALLSGFALRPARNSQLRTGTDSGNPTV